MSQTFSVCLLVLAGFVAANLPFISHRLLAVLSLAKPKTLAVRLLELPVFYFLVGGFGLFLENRVGQIAAQAWEFYAITSVLFVTFAFPGFVFRHLLRHRI